MADRSDACADFRRAARGRRRNSRLCSSSGTEFGWNPAPQPLREARFSVTRETSAGGVVEGTRRVVLSDVRGRFTLRLPAGSYRLAPLPQAHTTGGPLVRVVVHSDATAWALVRFEGYPKMV